MDGESTKPRILIQDCICVWFVRHETVSMLGQRHIRHDKPDKIIGQNVGEQLLLLYHIRLYHVPNIYIKFFIYFINYIIAQAE